jgi:hypothetical protein
MWQNLLRKCNKKLRISVSITYMEDTNPHAKERSLMNWLITGESALQDAKPVTPLPSPT